LAIKATTFGASRSDFGRSLAAYPRQNDLAVALRELGRVERTLFIIEWILDTDMQRRTQIGLNKGERIMRSRMRCVSGAKVKFVIARQKDSTTGSPASIS